MGFWHSVKLHRILIKSSTKFVSHSSKNVNSSLFERHTHNKNVHSFVSSLSGEHKTFDLNICSFLQKHKVVWKSTGGMVTGLRFSCVLQVTLIIPNMVLYSTEKYHYAMPRCLQLGRYEADSLGETCWESTSTLFQEKTILRSFVGNEERIVRNGFQKALYVTSYPLLN